MTKKVKTIKLYDGIRVKYNEEVYEIPSMKELWDLFGWDLEKDKEANECAHIIVRELMCFGSMDLSELSDGHLIVEVIPVGME